MRQWGNRGREGRKGNTAVVSELGRPAVGSVPLGPSEEPIEDAQSNPPGGWGLDHGSTGSLPHWLTVVPFTRTRAHTLPGYTGTHLTKPPDACDQEKEADRLFGGGGCSLLPRTCVSL